MLYEIYKYIANTDKNLIYLKKKFKIINFKGKTY